ncbi:MAG: sensor histidine kinase [Chitinophagaceae bacterium]|nr:sensor histidine kinase [Chitinophagaceae bacterium]
MLQLCFSQDKTIDSLLKRVAVAADDSSRSLYYAELASNYSGYDTSKALYYLQEAYRLNKKINLDFNWGCYYKCYATYIYDRGDYSRSLQMTDTSFGFFNKLEKKGNNLLQDEITFQKAELLISKGATYTAVAKSEESLLEYQEALRLLEGIRHPLKNQRVAVVYTNIANVFFLMEQYDKGLEYDLKSVPYYIGAKDDEMLAYAYTYVASDYMRLEKDDSAKIYFSKAEPLVTRLNKNTVNIEYYGKIGEMYWRQKDWKNTRKYYTIAYENARQINQVYNIIEYLRGIANCFYNEKKHKEADKYLQDARKLTEEKHLEGTQRDLYWTISRNYHHMGKYRLASDYMLYYTRLNDSVANETLKQKITEMDELFQSQKRQQEIVQLQKEKEIQQLSIRQKSTLNYILFGSVGALLVIGFLAYRNFRHKQNLSQKTAQLQTQRIKELEQEKQLIAYNSLLKGQEEERSRMAKDLHDGLGSMLSGVKLSLGAMKGNLILSEENARLFSKTLDQLDNSIGEMRRVAHNMMPEALVRLGLQQAVQDYCDSLTESQQLKINCQFHGLEERLDAATEIVVYRIVQELLNNVVKHSGADEILVQVMRHDNNLNITIEDNGKGFDVKNLDYRKGAGLGNVRSRVDYLKGQLDIQSVPGKGTSVHIDCILENN